VHRGDLPRDPAGDSAAQGGRAWIALERSDLVRFVPLRAPTLDCPLLAEPPAVEGLTHATETPAELVRFLAHAGYDRTPVTVLVDTLGRPVLVLQGASDPHAAAAAADLVARTARALGPTP
jgi:hypothetical protein